MPLLFIINFLKQTRFKNSLNMYSNKLANSTHDKNSFQTFSPPPIVLVHKHMKDSIKTKVNFKIPSSSKSS